MNQKIRISLTQLEKSITHAERIAYSKMSLDEVLSLPPGKKVSFFASLRVKHKKLEEGEALFRHFLETPSDNKIVGLIGPTGSGKTAFYESVVSPMVEGDPGEFPTLMVPAFAFGNSRTVFSGILRQILRVANEVSISEKRGVRVSDGRAIVIPRGLDGLRDAVTKMLKNRRVRVLAIDEFFHMVRYSDLDALMDAVKSLADDTYGFLMPIGGPSLIKFLTHNGEIDRRSESIYLGRYTKTEENQARVLLAAGRGGTDKYPPFESIVRKLQAKWPMEDVPQFHLMMDEIFDVTHGLVGLLKSLLTRCLIYQINNDGVWNHSFFAKSTKSKRALETLLEEIEKGETTMKEEQYGEPNFTKMQLEVISKKLVTKRRTKSESHPATEV
ncbi:AAA family ATPase [Paraburkholderia dipogonis]|nr:AAA family ATPase [Paraburkholderia dipogonis]